MSSGDFVEVAVDSEGRLSSAVRDLSEFLLGGSFESMAISNDDSTLEDSARRGSPLQQWCEAPFTESSAAGRQFKLPATHAALFPITEVLPQVVQAMRMTDVVCLIAPTGSGKSLLAPYLAEQLAQQQLDRPFPKLKGAASREPKGYRKSLLVAPNAEHVGSTTRCFRNLFGHSGIRVSAFLNPYEERQCWRPNEAGNITADQSSDFAITTYNAAIRVLPHARLNLLILDEVHEPNDNVQVTVAMALKMLLGSPFHGEEQETASRSLKNLLLMTATLDEKERKNYEEYFTSQGLSFKVLDFTEDLDRRKKLAMSCLYTQKDVNDNIPLPEMFEMTPMGEQIAKEFDAKGYGDRTAADYDADRSADVLHNRMRDSLNTVMGLACKNLRKRLAEKTKDYDMQSIIVILPGLEQVDRIYSASFKLPNFSFDGQAGFHPVRLTSLMKDDESITTECSQKGTWKPSGHLGRIVITTNLVATGLTVPNAAYCIDSGLQKMLREYTRDGLKNLDTVSIDRLQIVQRAGRTGRTTDGEYFLPYAVEKVDAMVKADHGDLLFNRNFEERHFLYKKLYKLKLLHEPPKRLRQELQASMEIRGLYNSELDSFPHDVVLMNSLLNFLPTEFARIVIQGTRLGIAAHAVLLVAECNSRVKFCRVGLSGSREEYYGPSIFKSAIDLYCEAMDAKHEENHDYRYLAKLPEKYRGVGDSIAQADLLASFFSVAPTHLKRSALDEIPVDACNFWSGENGVRTLADLYPAFVRDEGRDAVARYVSQIQSGLRSLNLVPKIGIFDPRLNRHIVSSDNFCLNEEGRALLSALLTMHSSRVGEQKWHRQQAQYRIFRSREEGRNIEWLYPESSYTQPAARKEETVEEEENVEEEEVKKEEGKKKVKSKKAMAREKRAEIAARKANKASYGRYTEMFERRGKYSGLIDPITLKQMTFLLNINGDRILREDSSECSLLLKLNASKGKRGMKIRLDPALRRDVDKVRLALARGLQALTHTRSDGLIARLEQFIIAVWREGEMSKSTTMMTMTSELEEMVFDDHPALPDDNSDEAGVEGDVEEREQQKEDRKEKKQLVKAERLQKKEEKMEEKRRAEAEKMRKNKEKMAAWNAEKAAKKEEERKLWEMRMEERQTEELEEMEKEQFKK